MKTLLRIDTSVRMEGSHTRALTGHFQSRWLSAHPGGAVLHRDLAQDPVPHFSSETLAGFYSVEKAAEKTAGARTLSDALIEDLRRADHVLIGSPLYNLMMPSTLKAYLDHVVRSGATFEVRDGHYQGLLKGKSATVITARGGLASKESPDDFQFPYLKMILAFMGIGPVVSVHAEGMALGSAAQEKGMAEARQQIDRLFEQGSSRD